MGTRPTNFEEIPCKSIRKVQSVARASTFDAQSSNRISAIIDGGGAAVEWLNAPVFKIVVDSRPPFESVPRQITKCFVAKLPRSFSRGLLY